MKLVINGVPVPLRRDGRAPKILFMAGLLVAGVAVLLVTGWLAVTSFLWPIRETPRGTCALWDPHNCTDLRLSFLERVGRIDLPDSSDVLDSGSNKSFLAGSEWGLVRLPEDAEPPAVSPLDHDTSGDYAWKRMVNLGFSSVNGTKSFSPQDRYLTEVTVGMDASGHPLVLIERRWNG
jgi:hypothetical protein